METYEDADTTNPHRAGEGTPVVVPLQVAVSDPGLRLELVHAHEEAQVDTHEEHERHELQDQAYEEDLVTPSAQELRTTQAGERTREPVRAFWMSSWAEADIEPPAA